MLFLFYFAIMKKRLYLSLLTLLFFSAKAFSQKEVFLFAQNATKEKRAQEYRNLVNNSINKNLLLPLTDSTEENWEDAFDALKYINYRSLWVYNKIKLAFFDSLEKRSTHFQRSLLELANSNYRGKFIEPAYWLLKRTKDPRIFATAAEYFLAGNKDPNAWNRVVQVFSKRADKDDDVPVYYGLLTGLITGYSDKKDLSSFFANLRNTVPGHLLLISFQRKNRNYPGIVLIRDQMGNFIKNNNGEIFSVPQLARSHSNMPFYLSSGNTPQGIFRMNGFDVSKSMAIGPTTNIQLMMPYETTPRYFLNDPSLEDTTWSEDLYRRLLPEPLKEYMPLYESFFASKAGRTEIIAHGTTVNTEYYKGLPWYPFTPTEGCLCTKEIWSTVDGKRLESDQQKLIDVLKIAGGANGYCIVIEIDDQQRPVSLNDILPYLK